MIDLHAHILHDIDDGPRTLAEAVDLARAFLADGVRMVAATPHGRSGYSVRYTVALYQQRLAELRAALAAADLSLELIPGTELFCAPDLPARLAAGEVLPYGASRAVLVEFPASVLPAAIEEMLFALQQAGYRVLIAHPERIRAVRENPNLLIPLIERGALMQLTALALIGGQGAESQRIAETILTHGMVHVLASDAHGAHLERMPELTKARRRAAELLDEAAATALVEGFPAALLADAPLDLPPPRPVAARRRWRLW